MKDLTGKKFNSWLVIREVERDKHNKRVWECVCNCGDTYFISQQNLCSGKSKRCRNCYRDVLKNLPKREDHRLYSTWKSMLNRCLNKNNRNYKNYGGRGIEVCKEWLDFEKFIEDMMPTFREGLTLDRVDVNGNYNLDNCRWADINQQSNNKVNSLSILFEGEYYTEANLARKTGVKRTTIQSRRNKGYTPFEMVYGK